MILLFSLKTYQTLIDAGIPCTVILDAAVAYSIGKVDLVLVGSEAVVESGGLVNAVGSFQIALIAKAANVPFYALAERSVVNFGPNPYIFYFSQVTNSTGCSHYLNMNCPHKTIKFFPFVPHRAPSPSQLRRRRAFQ